MRPFVTLEVVGRPATFATAHESAWKAEIRAAVARSDIEPPSAPARFSIRIEFRTVTPNNPNEQWDIDNLVKPTLDALEGVIGAREWKGLPQPADDRVDHLEAWKRPESPGRPAGATIQVRLIDEGDLSGFDR